MTLTTGTLAKAMGNRATRARYKQLVAANNKAMIEAGCTTLNRAAMWLAQIRQESGGLLWFTELASGSEYEGRPDLGNTHPGDGRRYKGRGPIQVTGRANYTALSHWAHSKGYIPTATYFVDNPDKLAEDEYGFLGAVWFWSTHGINTYADRGDVRQATLKINGGTNGLSVRTSYYRAIRAMGTKIIPKPPRPSHTVTMYTTEPATGYGHQGKARIHYPKGTKLVGVVDKAYAKRVHSYGDYLRVGKIPHRRWIPVSQLSTHKL